ncbi:iron copper transporter [Cadophora sp. MPI-SDFR-AT-0126]|nr:iron copper transporter [Leotiomycetes sp. MPI-SDFR-AT-0126]
MARTYEYNVKMSCGGCASTIKEAVNGKPGVKSIDIALETQTVTVVTDDEVTFDIVPAMIKQAGKEVQGGKLVVREA